MDQYLSPPPGWEPHGAPRMGIGGVKGSVARLHVDGTRRWWSCPRCGERNPTDEIKCRDCLTPRPSYATTALEHEETPAPRAKIVQRKVTLVRRKVLRKTIAAPTRSPSKLDALRRVLDAFSRPKEVEKFECPVCKRVVDETVAVCGWGAIFQGGQGQP